MTRDDLERHDQLTPEEQDAFAALPRERVPPAHLEDRVVDALHGEGLLANPRALRTLPRWWMAVAAIGAVAFFSSGLAMGQWLGVRNTAVLGQDAVARAMAVQSAGSEYVRAVARLSELADGEDPGAAGPGFEAAQVALHAAALELALLSPDDPTIAMVLAVLERYQGQGAEQQGSVRQTIWF